MAQHKVEHACGHAVTYRLYGKGQDEMAADKAGERCPPCARGPQPKTVQVRTFLRGTGGGERGNEVEHVELRKLTLPGGGTRWEAWQSFRDVDAPGLSGYNSGRVTTLRSVRGTVARLRRQGFVESAAAQRAG